MLEVDLPYGERRLAFASVSSIVLLQLADIVKDEWECGS